MVQPLEPGPGFGVGRGFAIRGPFPVQAPDKAPETCTWSTRSADRGSQVSALGVGLPSGTPFRCRHRIKHRKRAPGQRGLRVAHNLLSRNLDGNQIAWKYRRCAGHANLLFRDGVKRQVGKCDCLLEFTTRPELSQSRRESGHNSMCQNGLKILLRAIVRHGPKTGDLPSVWLDTCGSLPYQPDALARVAASPSQGFAGSKASRGQRLRGVKPCSGLRKAGRRPRTGFAGPFKGAGPLFGHRDLESRSPGRRSSGRAVSSLFEDALGHADVLSQFTRPGQGTIDATNQMVDAIGMIQAEDRGYYPGKKVSHPCTY